MSTLELNNISFAYGNGAPVIDGVSLEVKAGERVVLAAPSGYGKSTLCKIAAGYVQPQQGEVVLDGQPLPQSGACPVQLIWQHPEQALDPRITMRSSLLEAGSIDTGLLAELGIRDEWLSRYPLELSGGELQRVCIARALRVRPKFLIADEISTMLDAVTQAQIWEFLLDYAQRNDLGIITVTHSPALANRIATRIVNLAK